MLSIWSGGLDIPLYSIRESRKKISKMPNINLSQTTSDIILFAAQVIDIYIIISISLYNLTQTIENKELSISLLRAVSVTCYLLLRLQNMLFTLPNNSSISFILQTKCQITSFIYQKT